jgi:hypothetical protein
MGEQFDRPEIQSTNTGTMPSGAMHLKGKRLP